LRRGSVDRVRCRYCRRSATGTTFCSYLLRRDTTAWDGGASRSVSEEFEYDGYGDPKRAYHYGDTAVGSDERDVRTDWLVVEASWLHRPSRTALYNGGGDLRGS